MAINYDRLMAWPIADARQEYTAKDCVLYALGLGFGSDALDPRHLLHVYERGLEPLPSMVLVLAMGERWASNPATGIDYTKVVVAEQSFTSHRRLPVRGSVLSRSRVTEVIDKGPGRGAIVRAERQIFLDGDAAPTATLSSSLFCRADGGFGGPPGSGTSRPPPQGGEPDAVVRLQTPPQLALIYRLSGDMNPLHADPAIAIEAGFPAPILHGLCSFGLALRAAAESLDLPAQAIVGAGVRFTGVVYPGEALETAIWRVPEGLAFRTRVPERDKVVLDLGWVHLD